MFNLFRRKTVPVTVHDKIWMSESNKFQFLAAAFKKDNQLVIICWFDDTCRKIETFFTGHPNQPLLLLAREARHAHISGRQVIFCGHHPLYEKETALFMELQLKEVIICSSLDEPMFTSFGGEKIISLMKQLGMEESENIEHPLITRSIRNAQEKIAKKLVFEQPASSQEEWFKKNVVG